MQTNQKSFRNGPRSKPNKADQLNKKLQKEEKKLDKIESKLVKQEKQIQANKPSNEQRKQKKKGVLSRVGNFLLNDALPIAGDLVFPGGGSLMRKAVKSLTGHGAYYLNMNDPQGVPSFGDFDKVRITNREYLGTVKSTTSFKTTKLQLNPGLANMFPWLSTIAQQFEKYKFNGLALVFKSTAASAFSSSTNIALGEVMFTSVPDPEEAAPASLTEVLNRKHNSVAKPNETIVHGWECMPGANVVNGFFVRSGALSSSEDLALYDPGYVMLSTNGNPANDMEIGQLWITYDITLIGPKLPTGGLGGQVLTDFFYQNTGINGANPFGLGSFPPTSGSTMQGTLYADFNQYIFPTFVSSGTFLVVYNCIQNDVAGQYGPTVTSVTNGSILTSYIGSTIANPRTFNDSAGDLFSIAIVKVNASGAVIQFGTGTITGTTPKCNLMITQLAPSFNSSLTENVQLSKMIKLLGLSKKQIKVIEELAQEQDSWDDFEH